MSPIGRIFSVLNLILAALFLSWAANNLATSHQYKEKLEAAETAAAEQVAELESSISDLNNRLDTKTTEADNANNELQSAQDDARRVRQENEKLNSTNDELSATNGANASTIASFQEQNSALESSAAQAVAAQHDAEGQRDDALSSAAEAATLSADLTAQNEALNKQINDLQGEIVALNGRISELDTNFATLVDVTGANLDDILAQQLINAAVIQVNYDIKPGLVALNVGSNKGVTRGYTFQIFNGGQYKGEARVENVRDDMCTALITSTLAGQTIKQGDSASTRL